MPAECEKLKTSYQLKEFEKQKPTDQFAAFGDNEGLIVLSAATRNWFPTNNNAEKNYTEIQLSDKGEVKKLSYHL